MKSTREKCFTQIHIHPPHCINWREMQAYSCRQHLAVIMCKQHIVFPSQSSFFFLFPINHVSFCKFPILNCGFGKKRNIWVIYFLAHYKPLYLVSKSAVEKRTFIIFWVHARWRKQEPSELVPKERGKFHLLKGALVDEDRQQISRRWKKQPAASQPPGLNVWEWSL